MPTPEISPTKGAVVNISADGAVTVVTWWAPLYAEYGHVSEDAFTVDGDRLDWQTLIRSDVGRIVKTVIDNIGFSPENGPITVIEARSE